MEPEQCKLRGQNVEARCGVFAPCPAPKPWQPHKALSKANSKYFRRLGGRIKERAFNNIAVMGGGGAAAYDG
jgi:hypothetical protein